MVTSLALCLSLLSVLILAASAVLPKLVAPNFPDLSIKTRHTSGDQFSELRALYLKGFRQRIETVVEKPAPADAINSASIWQCDEKLHFFLNQRDKIYKSSVNRGQVRAFNERTPNKLAPYAWDRGDCYHRLCRH